MSLIQKIKQNKLLRYINDVPLLNIPAFKGTSGIGLLSDEIDTYINIYNSIYHFEGIDIGSQKIILNNGKSTQSINLKLKKNESKIFKLSDYFKKSKNLEVISCRVFNKNFPFFVPYFYSTVINKKNDNISLFHSSSMGNTIFKPNSKTLIGGLYSKSFFEKSQLILCTLHNYKPNENNQVIINFMDHSKNIVNSVSCDFLGQTCKISLANYVKNLKQNKNYFIEIHGPAFSNPYIFHNSETLFHM